MEKVLYEWLTTKIVGIRRIMLLITLSLSLSAVACLLIAALPGDLLPRFVLGFIGFGALCEVAWIIRSERNG